MMRRQTLGEGRAQIKNENFRKYKESKTAGISCPTK